MSKNWILGAVALLAAVVTTALALTSLDDLRIRSSIPLGLAKPADASANEQDESSTDSGLTTQTILVPDQDAKVITQVVANIISNAHFLRQDFNNEISRRFLERYLNVLDYFHLQFLSTDEAEFAPLANHLDELTLKGDVTPAYLIYQRYLERLEQRVDYVTTLLQTEKFEFNTSERYTPDRHLLPRPSTLAEAQKLWRDRLRFEVLQEKLTGAKHEDTVKKLSNRYQRLLKSARENDSSEILLRYLNALCRVYDPHSDYFDKNELENFSIGMKLSLYGIGALLSSDDGYCKIVSLVPGGPAELGGQLKPNDKIIAVAQGEGEPVDVVEMNLNKVVRMIRGEKGTIVNLTVIPASSKDASERKIVPIVRAEIKLEDQEAKAFIFDHKDASGKNRRLAVIDIPSFYADFELMGKNKEGGARKSTTADVIAIIKKLEKEGVDGLVLDLRRNGGGSLDEAITLTGLFIKEGPVVQVRDAIGRTIVNKDEDPSVLYDGPLVVLTSHVSASASEIFAGALQDYGRAVLIGDSSTHGKGTVQSLVQLDPFVRQIGPPTKENPGALKITVQKFYRASGSSTQLKGVVPDLVISSLWDYDEIGESALDNPLPWDTIAPADDFQPMQQVESLIPELKKRSAARLANNRDFLYLREDIELLRKLRSDKSISMNETERKKEKKDAEEKVASRKKERKDRGAEPVKVVRLQLADLSKPGLPPAMVLTNRFSEIDLEEEPDADKRPDAEPEPVMDIIRDESLNVLSDLMSLKGNSKPLVVGTRPIQ